ncbi:hypothetical protein GF314_02795 [bacterium]|nr:hypothetical protein [bacterium]
MQASSARSPIPLPVSLVGLAAVAALYLITRQQQFTIDSLYYLWDTEFGAGPRLLHPHHLLMQPVLRAVWSIWAWFEWPGRAVLPLQVFNVGVTLAALAAFWRLLRRLVPGRWSAPVWWLALALAYLPWQQSTQAEGVPMYLLMATLLLWWAVRLPQGPRPTRRTALELAGTVTVAVLVHQALVLWAPPVAVMLAREGRPGERWTLGALTLGAAGATVLALYVASGAVATGSLAPADLWQWFTGYTDEFAGRCGSFALLFSTDVPRGLASSILTGAPLKPYVFGQRPADPQLAARLLPFAIVAVTVGVGLLRLKPAGRAADPSGRRALLNVAVLVIIAALFAGWWEPANRKFWAPVLPGLLALAAVGWSAPAGRWPRLAVAVPLLMTALLFGYNLAGGILPRHRHADARQPLVVFLARMVDEGDVVILQEDRVWQTAIYFRPDRDVHGIPGQWSDRGDPGQTVLRKAVAAARQALVDGKTVYVAASEWDAVGKRLQAALGPLPDPVPVLEFGDAELLARDQVLLAVQLPRG